ncbi:G-I-Y Y-I-G endonuclease [Gordonia phage Pytheas]|nr:G-I-Y Y-I-G endonuclease [Gordonia Phage Jablanski]UYL88101.1 G-I-Y Y-I-G endonuclease [Gordonia phage Pytheas]
MYRRHFYRDDIAGPTWLYRLFTGSEVAYVGVSSNPKARLALHRRRKAWWASVDRVELKWFPSRADAFAAEKQSIINDRPIHNVARPKEALA